MTDVMRDTRKVVSLSAGLLALSVWSQIALAGRLLDELNRLQALLDGKDTPFERIERESSALLDTYTARQERALILYNLASIYAQSGQVRPGKTIEYVRRCLENPLPPTKRAQAFIYWGDAIQVANAGVRGEALARARRAAVMPYLLALKEQVSLNLPEERPDMLRIRGMPPKGTGLTAAQYKKLKAEFDAAMAENAKRKFQSEMILYRDCLVSQTAFLYSRRPLADDEIRRLAAEVTGDQPTVNRLMRAIWRAQDKRKAKVKARTTAILEEGIAELDPRPFSQPSSQPDSPEGSIRGSRQGQRPLAGEPEPSPPWRAGLGPPIAAASVAALLGALALVRWRRRSRKA